MSLDYKILGQLYYGPEINETPEIPGTSGYYTYTTGGVQNLYVSIGSRGGFSNDSTAAIYSTDGINWNTGNFSNLLSTFSAGNYGIAYGNNTFVVVGEDGVNYPYHIDKAAYSTDGINWEVSTLPSSQIWKSVVYGDGKFVAIGTIELSPYVSNKAAYSADGINWTEIILPASSVWFYLLYDNGKFVAQSYPGTQVASSTDGITWTLGQFPIGNSNSYWSRIVNNDSTFVSFYNPNSFPYTSDKVAVSSDAINWTTYTLPLAALWRNAAYGNNKFVVVSQEQTPKAAYSTNGITWTLTSNLPTGDNLYDFEFINGLFIYVAQNGTYYSTDAVSWSATNLPSGQIWTIVYDGGKFVATSGQAISGGAQTNKSAYSIDGMSWTNVTLPIARTWRSLAYGQINTLTEVQISIGGQGTPGSYVEIIEPQIVYTVPAGTETTITSIYVTNHDSVERTYDLAIVPANEELSLKHNIRWDMPVGASNFDLNNAKITMSAGDRVYVFPSTINKVGFTLFGVEKS